MKVIGVIVALAAALALQTTVAGLTIGGGTAVNLVLVAVVFVALSFGPVPGLLAGSAGGIVQDALAGGIIGVGGLSKTIVGFLVGVLGAQFIVAHTLPRLVMFVGATVAHEICFQSLYSLVESRGFALRWWPLLLQAGINGMLGIVAFVVVESGPGLVQGRDARRHTVRRRY